MIAGDLTQDTFVKLIKGIESYKFTGKFINYLFTIAVNTCNDYFRKTNETYGELEDLEDQFTISPMENVLDQEEKIYIRKIIDALPAYQKEAIILYYYHDMKGKDIARITGEKLSTIKSRLKQGKDRLRKILEEEEYFEK